jgi:hypothetical protein
MKKSELWEYEGDDAFWKKMTQSSDPAVRKLAARVKTSTYVVEIPLDEFDSSKGDRYKETTKVRTIDPDVLQEDGSVLRLTQLCEEYRLAREAYLARKSGSHCYRVVEGC